MKQPSVVTVDLDSTLCENSHRNHLRVEPWGFENYLKYEQACGDDSLIEGVGRLVRLLGQSHALIGVSARTEAVRDITWDWLNRHDLAFSDLRLDADFSGDWWRNHSDYKAYQISRLQDEGHDVVLHIDDWAATVESLRPLNVPVLVVRPPWSFSTDPVLLR